jgi:hypothetical protein
MKDALSIETLIKVLSSFGAYFALMAFPEKIVVVSLAFMVLCVFIFSIWAYFQTRKSNSQTNKLLDVFEQRFLLTESRTNLLTDKHIKRHPEDGAAFFQLERLQAQERFDDMQDGALCGSCGKHDKRD